MIKDHAKQYCTEAFRFYARTGKTYEQLKNEMLRDPVNKVEYDLRGCDIGKPTEWEICHIEDMIGYREAELLDLVAVEKTLNQMNDTEKDVIKMVYFKEPNMELSKGDISARVDIASVTIPIGVATVYRILRKARNIFCLERKLRL